MKHYVRAGVYLLFAFFSTVISAADTPNVVIILADDLGYGDLGCYGATKVKTPNMDRLAMEARRFTDAHSASAVCTPSRYALLTGEYPFRRNIWGPLRVDHPLVIDPQRLTLGQMFKQRGYATACVGKWHLGFGRKTTDWNKPLKPGPLELGFDYYYGLPLVNSGPPFVYVENHRVVGWDPADPFVLRQKNDSRAPSPVQQFPAKHGMDRWSGATRAHELYRDEELGATLTTKAVQWMRSLPKESPFFLYFATPHIHHPFTPSGRFKGSSQCGHYGDFIHELDWMVGEILRSLDELNLRDNTLVILTSDNGGMLNHGGQDAWRAGHRMNGKLLGFKFDSWEGGHRVPFIACWPGKIEAGSISDQLICHVDMLAAMAALTGAALSQADAPDSFNVLPALTGAPAEPIRDHAVIAAFRKKNLAIRQGRWVYIGAQGGGGFDGDKPGNHTLGGPAALKFAGETNSDIEDGRLKADAPAAQLYDLEVDPSQSRNLIREYPEVAARLKSLLFETQAKAKTRKESKP